MSPIQTIVSPHRDHVRIAIPKEYRSYSFQVILVPIAPNAVDAGATRPRKRRTKKSFVDALLECPKCGYEGLEVTRDGSDFDREIDL